MEEHLLRPIQEASYLTAGNAWRYRTILRFFYEQHERLRHYLFPEEILVELKQNVHFLDYTSDQLQQDLDQLVEWKNLVPRQETGRVTSVEAFKKKKFRYQLTPYTVEIERMVTGLEQLGESFGGSLERTLFDRLLDTLLKLTAQEAHPVTNELRYAIQDLDAEQLNRLWEDLFDDFRNLTENATDYLAHLQSEKIEEKMMAEAFLLYKDAITQYLRNFMTSLQRTSFRIESVLEDTAPSFVDHLAENLSEYQLSIPRIDEGPSKEEWMEKYRDQWQVLRMWFMGNETVESDMVYLQNATNETIRRLTRFAQRLGETQNSMRSRRMDYMHLAKWFSRLETMDEANKLSACVFGVPKPRHLFIAEGKKTENIHTPIFEQPAFELEVRPRVRAYREKQKPNAVVDRSRQKEEMLRAYLDQKAAEQRMLDQLMENDRIVFSQLEEIDASLRKTLLSWIAKSIAHRERMGKTESGREYKLIQLSDRSIILQASDGEMEMPDYMLQFFG